MMVTPEIRYPRNSVKPFTDSQARLLLSLYLQVPVTTEIRKPGCLTYVNPNLTFFDSTSKLKFSYVIGVFSNSNPSPSAESIKFDEPAQSWQLHCSLSGSPRLVNLEPGTEMSQSKPWKGWKHFTFSVGAANFQTAIRSFLQQKPDMHCSSNPADYYLEAFHLNAELKYQSGHAELGWSMRDASIQIVKQ